MSAIGTFNGRIKGSVVFTKKGSKVIVKVNLSGFPYNKLYAMHIHEYGDLSNGCMSCGGHFSKGSQIHGEKESNKDGFHSGDLINNIYPHNGKVNITFEAYGFAIPEIYGRSLMIHEESDDYGLQGTKYKNKFYSYKELSKVNSKFIRNYYNRRYHSEKMSLNQIVNKLNKESLKTGNAGGRMACVVIGRKNE